MIAAFLPEAARLARRGGHALLDALLPPQCLNCRAPVERPGQLCIACWQGVDFIAEPCCDACGLPFDFDQGPAALCGACARVHPAFDRARSVMRYGKIGRKLILAFKHADRTEAAPAFALWAARAGVELMAACDVVAPVPLHRWRLLRRRYNQAALVARALGRLATKPVLADLLRRHRATPSQGGLNAVERWRNVRGAFAVAERYRSALAGRSVLLVDDVMTTGATLEACALALKNAGAARVEALTLARVVPSDGDTI